MAAEVKWRGVNAERKQLDYVKSADGVVEYTEIWTGNPQNAVWPSYAIGDTITPTFGTTTLPLLAWYSITAEQGQNKALAQYTAKASNKFHDVDTGDVLAKWSLEYSQDWVTLPGVAVGIPVAFPIITKTTLHISPPPTGTPVWVEQSPPSPPFGFYSPTITGYSFIKINDSVSRVSDGYSRQQQWKQQLSIPSGF